MVDTTKVYTPFLVENTTATPTATITPAPGTKQVWIDLNNNGVYESKTDVIITPGKPVTLKVTKGIFTVYGAVSEIDVRNSELTNADLRANPALKKFNIAGNKFAPATLLDNSFNFFVFYFCYRVYARCI